jgi:hypothetical protein
LQVKASVSAQLTAVAPQLQATLAQLDTALALLAASGGRGALPPRQRRLHVRLQCLRAAILMRWQRGAGVLFQQLLAALQQRAPDSPGASGAAATEDAALGASAEALGVVSQARQAKACGFSVDATICDCCSAVTRLTPRAADDLVRDVADILGFLSRV